ncbi:ATPase family associated with various cellular activities (AAA) [Carpediemonas membranifera]|nr:ATPase family associated with various cellular activities (AAA) [Carpediemonas membranifera]|eukprot:KAG9397228.1 ATPase family associated with various cellular activities (AAA) [Carpediemonas membranifera]
MARYYAPSTIFIDEIDSLMTERSTSGEHEGSRRLKTELLIQMDGLHQHDASKRVFVMCASNLPWQLDSALLRRLDKRILVDLPSADARQTILTNQLSDRIDERALGILPDIVDATDGLSGSDLVLMCREALMRPIRRFMDSLDDDLEFPGTGEAGEGAEDGEAEGKVEPVTAEDLKAAQAATTATTNADWRQRCAKFMDERGAA